MVERALGTIPSTVLDDNVVSRFYFVRMDFRTDPPGIVAFCNKPGGLTANIGDTLNGVSGGSRTWVETDFRVQNLSQTQNNILEVSAIDFANGTPGGNALDGYWSNLLQVYGLREQSVGVYVVWFDVTDDSILGTYQIYAGQINETAIRTRANLSLTPFTTPHSVIVPGGEYSSTCINFYKDEFCQYAGGLGTCERTMTDCIAHDNLIHFTGFPFLPAPNTTLIWGKLGQIRFQPG